MRSAPAVMRPRRPYGGWSPLCKMFPLWAALTAGLPAVATAQHTRYQAAISKFEAQLAADVAADGLGSIVAAVVVGDDVIWARGFGWADPSRSRPADTGTIGRIGSITKSFTALVVVRLHELRVLDLDDPVVKYVPELIGLPADRRQVQSITLRHLASHTGGLGREPQLEGAAAGPISGWDSKILASIPKTAVESRPGERYSYSNIGVGILGLAAVRAAGRDFMDLVDDFVVRPLGMRSTTFVISPELAPRLSAGYANGRYAGMPMGPETPALEHAGRGYKVPNGGLYSTVGDLARFVSGQTGASPQAILSEESRLEMQSVQTPGDSGSGYGLGFSIEALDDGRKFVGHGGSVSGYNANLVFETRSRIGVLLLRNYDNGSTNLGGVARSLLRELTGDGAGLTEN